MVGHGVNSAGSYLADPTSPIRSHCASISTVRDNVTAKWQMRYTHLTGVLCHMGYFGYDVVTHMNFVIAGWIGHYYTSTRRYCITYLCLGLTFDSHSKPHENINTPHIATCNDVLISLCVTQYGTILLGFFSSEPSNKYYFETCDKTVKRYIR